MSHPTGTRRAIAGTALGGLAVALVLAATSSASTSTPATITGTPITRMAMTAKPGTVVPAADLVSARVFATSRIGVALAAVGQAQYAARTLDGGRTWKLDSPALHVNAAQAPLAVDQVLAAGPDTYYAWGGGGQAVDATSDGGQHWWRAFLGDAVVGAASEFGRLIAFAQTASQGGAAAVTSVYVSTDGGHHWRLDDALGT